ncbi:DNA polymerase I [Phaeocystidibacter luteus]|uniref:DNA polymerase I n=1 Tax=Phaeocystidibacter luteus TaxID=911197 RepID=A0A6N6RIX8_9FLAO|nr:DNA polymerase I [Phaeocystidibacter luteus]KAB2805409.1 DNA polymerase I [Phaeocystidibacter luteus]
MSDAEKKLFLLDAYALIFRAYFAFARNPRVTSKGMDTSAIYGFTTALLDVLNKENPTHIAVVFDMKGPTKRHEMYEEYKANRDETPEAIKIAVPYIQKVLDAFRIPYVGVEGYEADDVIGTLAKQAEKDGYITYMMTPDKDFGQLVTDNILMYKPARGGGQPEVMGPKEICEKWDIENVDQVIDILGMMGDSADNIPGLPGVGEKTAVKLLKQYGTMENVLEHADEIKGKLGEKIRDNADLGRLSKELATIWIDAPILLSETDVTRDPIDEDKLKEVFEELEFRTLAKRILDVEIQKNSGASVVKQTGDQMDLFGGTVEAADSSDQNSGVKTLENTEHHYQKIDDEMGIQMLMKKLVKQKAVCFDTETTSLNALEAELVGIAFSYDASKAYYIPVPADQDEAQKIVDLTRPFFENTEVEKIAQNLKYDMTVLQNYGIVISGPLFDTMLAHYLLQPDMRHNMDLLAETYLNYRPVSIETLIGKKGKSQGSMRDVEIDKVVEYAGEDADITYQLYQKFKPGIAEGGVEKVFYDVETPLVPVLAAMEFEGINVDVDALNAYSVELEKELKSLEESIIEDAGERFNLGSPRQLGEILFGKMQLMEKPKKTKSGQYSTSEDILQGLTDKHPIVGKILDWRQVGKLKSTYVDALPQLVSKQTGRIHTTYNQTVAATGRLSSTNPNLQNIPIRTERGRKVRGMFIPRDENHILLAADYSQIELRIIAALSGDEAMISAFKNGEDIHAATAAKVFDVKLEDVTREQRSHAKTVNFGIIYGVSAFGLSQQTNLSRTEAKEVIEAYFRTYPGIRDYIDNQVALAQKQGYVETMFGRRRYLKDINSRNAVVRGHAERNAVNAPIQGTAADVIKLAMIKIHKRMQDEGMKSRMLLQVHDELVFDAEKSELNKLKELVAKEMENAVALEVPLLVETGTGENWLEAH